MNEEYLKGLHGHLKIKDDYDTWINAVKDNQEYLTGLHGSLKIKDDYDTWNTSIFGNVKKKEETSEVSTEPVVASGEELQGLSEEPSSDPQSTLKTEDPTPSPVRAEAQKPFDQRVLSKFQQAVDEIVDPQLTYEEPSKNKMMESTTRDWLELELTPEEKITRPLSDKEADIAKNVLSGLQHKYIDNEGGYELIGASPRYAADIYAQIPTDVSQEQRDRIFHNIDKELKNAGKTSKFKEGEAKLDKQFSDEVGSITYQYLKDNITNSQFTGESDMYSDYEYLVKGEGDDDFFSPAYVWKQYNTEGGTEDVWGDRSLDRLTEMATLKGRYKNEAEAYEAWQKGDLSVKNILQDDMYKPLVNSWLKENVSKGAIKSQEANLKQYTTAEPGTKAYNRAKQEMSEGVDDYMEQYMSTKQKVVKLHYDKLYKLSQRPGTVPEKANHYREMIEDFKDSEGELFDPITGTDINKSDADERTIQWNRNVDQYAVKFSNPKNTRQTLIDIRDRLYWEFQYLEGEVDKNIGNIKSPIVDLGTYPGGARGKPLFGGSAFLDKYKDTFQQLLAVNRALSQNEDLSKIPKSLGGTFTESLLESTGTGYYRDEDLVQDYATAVKAKGGKISPEYEERLEKTFNEELAEVAGSSIPSMAKIIGVTLITEGLGFVEAATSAFNVAKTFSQSKMMTTALNVIEQPLISGIQYSLAKEGFATGVGESLGAQAYDLSKIPELISKTKLGLVLKTSLNTLFKQVSMGGAETVQEYTGEFMQRLYDNEEIGESLKNTIGDDPSKKLALTYELSFLLGASSLGANYKESKTLMEDEILASKSTDPAVVEVQDRIKKERASAEEGTPEDQQRGEVVRKLRTKAEEVAKTEETTKVKETPVAEKKETKVEEPNKEEKIEEKKKNERGQKRLNKASIELSSATSVEEKAKAINTFEDNASQMTKVNPEDQAKIDKAKEELKEEGYEMPDLVGEKMVVGDKYADVSQITDDPTLEKGTDIITKVVSPPIYKDGKLWKKGIVDIKRGTKVEQKTEGVPEAKEELQAELKDLKEETAPVAEEKAPVEKPKEKTISELKAEIEETDKPPERTKWQDATPEELQSEVDTKKSNVEEAKKQKVVPEKIEKTEELVKAEETVATIKSEISALETKRDNARFSETKAKRQRKIDKKEIQLSEAEAKFKEVEYPYLQQTYKAKEAAVKEKKKLVKDLEAEVGVAEWQQRQSKGEVHKIEGPPGVKDKYVTKEDYTEHLDGKIDKAKKEVERKQTQLKDKIAELKEYGLEEKAANERVSAEEQLEDSKKALESVQKEKSDFETKTKEDVSKDKDKQPTVKKEQRIDEEVSTQEEQQTIGEQEVSEQKADVLEYTSKDSKYKITESGDIVHAKGTKKGAKVSEPTKRKVLREKAAIESNTAPRVSDTIVMEEGMTPNDVTEVVIKESANPSELAEEIVSNPAEEVDHKESFIADYMPTKISRDSFLRWGDKSYVNASVARSYGLRKKGGEDIDTVAQEMSDAAGVEITPQDVIDFIVSHPQGVDQFHARIKAESINGRLKTRFKEVTGLDYTGKAAEDIAAQAIEIELSDQFTDYPPEVLEAIEEYHKLEPDAETRYKDRTAKKQITEETGSTKDDKGVKKEPTVSERLTELGDRLQAGLTPSLKDIKFAKEQGIDIKKPIDQQIEKALEQHKKNLNSTGPALFVNLNAIKSATKLVKLYTLKGVKSYRQFIRISKLQASNWLRKVYDSFHSGKNADMKFGYRNLRSRVSLDNSLEALTMLNEVAKKIKATSTVAEAELAKEAMLAEVHEIIKMIDSQIVSTKSKETKIELNNSRDYILDFYSRTKKSDAITMAKQYGAELKDVQKAAEYKLRVKRFGILKQGLQWLQDSKLPQLEIEKQLREEAGREIGISKSAYELSDLAISMTEAQNLKIEEYVFGGRGKTKDSLLGRMKKDGLTEDDLGLYMYARHVEERNARMAALQQLSIDEKIKKIEDGDSLNKDEEIQETIDENPIDEAGSGMTNAEAQEFIDDFEEAGKKESLDKYADEFKANVTDKIAENLYKGGVITKDQYENLINGVDEKTDVKFNFYAPLKVEGGIYNDLFAEDGRQAEGRFGKTTTTGRSVGVAKVLQKLTPSKKAGRIKYHQRNSPFKQAVQDLYATSALVNKNIANKALYDMVKENPNPEIWKTDAKFSYVDPDGNARSNKIEDGAVPVYIDGKTKYVILVDPHLKSAWEKRKTNPTWGWVSKNLNRVNSYLRNIFTIYNPEFALVNKVRDMQDAFFNLSAEDSVRVIKKFTGYTARSMRDVANYELGRDTKGEKLMEEMMAHGGFVSWANYENVSSVVKDINKASADYHRRASKNPLLLPVKALKLGVKGLDIFNAMMEQSTRLSIYRALRDTKIEDLSEAKTGDKKGMSLAELEKAYPKKVNEIKLEAASGSKNITINFNKKGLGGSFLNTLYLFSNAGIQAAVKPFKVIGTKGAVAPKIVSTLALAGGMAYKAWLNSMLDDDEMRDLLNEYDYENNIVIPLGSLKDGLVFTLPKSYGGFRILWNTGEALGNLSSGGNISDLFSAMGKELYQVINPVSGSYDGSLLSSFVPTAVRPWAEIETNQNYAGNRITPHKYLDSDPDFLSKNEKVPEGFKDFAKFMYDSFGLDAHPETYKHWFSSYTGGVWQTGQRAMTPLMSEGMKQHREYFLGDKYDKEGMANTPIARRFLKNVKEEEWRVTNKLYTARDKITYIEDIEDQDVRDFGRYLKKSLDKELIDVDKAKRMDRKYIAAIKKAEEDGRITLSKAKHLIKVFNSSF